MSVTIKMNFLIIILFRTLTQIHGYSTEKLFLDQSIYSPTPGVTNSLLPRYIMNQPKFKTANMVIEFSEYVMYFIFHRVTVL